MSLPIPIPTTSIVMGILWLQTSPAVVTDAGMNEWIRYGLLGLVLAWMFLVHLPGEAAERSKRAIADAEEREKERKANAEEREKDRLSRHQLANAMQAAIAEMHQNLIKVQATYFTDTQKDRDALADRTMVLKNVIEQQTKDLTKAISEGCQFQPHLLPAPGKKS